MRELAAGGLSHERRPGLRIAISSIFERLGHCLIQSLEALLLILWVQAAVELAVIAFLRPSPAGHHGKPVLECAPELRALPPEAFNESLVVLEAVLLP